MSSTTTPTPTTVYPPSSASTPSLSSSFPTLPASSSTIADFYPSPSSVVIEQYVDSEKSVQHHEQLAQAKSADIVTEAPEGSSELSDDLISPYCWRDIYGDDSNRQRYIDWVKDHPPFVRLPAAYIFNAPPSPSLLRNFPGGRLPLLHYGLALTTAELMKFASKCTHGRIDLDAPRAAFVTAQYLSRRTKLAFKNQRPLSLEYSFVMSLGTNRDMDALRYEQDSVQLARDVREVLGVERQLSFRWWWDRVATDLSSCHLPVSSASPEELMEISG